MAVSLACSIPFDEQDKFSKHMFNYSLGEIIIREGDDSNAIYLLREGKVAVDRGRGTQIATIESVNFFGEMANIIKSRRTATIRVISPRVVVYKFETFDLNAIYNNPAWSEILITRLCNNVAEIDKQLEGALKEKQTLAEKINDLFYHSSTLCSALLSTQLDLTDGQRDTSKEWKLMQQLQSLSEPFHKVHQ